MNLILNNLQIMFEEIDKENAGEVSNKEIIAYLKIMSEDINNAQVKRIFKKSEEKNNLIKYIYDNIYLKKIVIIFSSW